MLRSPALLLTLLAVALPAASQEGSGAPTGGAAPEAATVRIPGGSYRPLQAAESARVEVPTFLLDRTPVTVEAFRAFLTEAPEWRRDAAPPALVGTHYLAGWDGEMEPGEGTLEHPVTEVSWFAARAYCRAQGGRLPSTHEWEYAARIPEAGWQGPPKELNLRFLELRNRRPTARDLPSVEEAWENALGVRGLHGLVEEWTSDFNNQMATGAGRDDRGLDRGLFCAAGSVGVPDPSDYAAFLRAAVRAALVGTEGGPLLGFRCAYDLPG